MYPTDYALACLIGSGLRYAKITVVFARIIQRNIKATETKMEFPVSLDTLIKKLETNHSVQEISMSYHIQLTQGGKRMQKVSSAQLLSRGR